MLQFLPCQCSFLGLLSNPIPAFSRTKSKEMGIISSDDGNDSITDVSEREQSDAESSYTAMSNPDIGGPGVPADYKPNSTIRLSGIPAKPSVRLSMKTLMLLSLFVNVANGCGSNAYRCVNSGGSVDDDAAITRACMIKVGFDSDCYCYHMAETYADPYGNDINAFKNCCRDYDHYYPREC